MSSKGKGKVVDVTKIGLTSEPCKTVADGLKEMLANTYALYLKTQNFHWNVTGPQFYSLHKLLEEQYEDLAEAVDEIAERIRTLDQWAPGSFKAFSALMDIKESDGPKPATEMLTELLADNEILSKLALAHYHVADDIDDQSSAGLLADRMTAHEKAAWMLRAHLAK